MKAKLVAVALLVAIGGLGLAAFGSWRQRAWSRGLMGPFAGQPYTGELATTPTSVLTIAGRGRLEVHQVPSLTAPVLAFRPEDGSLVWAHLLVPQRRLASGETETAAVSDFRLRRLSPTRTGFQALVTCEWDWGGRERGLIDLGADYGFKSFGLDW